MSESTVDRHVYIFLHRMVYTAYNCTGPEAAKVEYTRTSSQATLIIQNTQTLKFYSDPPPPILQRTFEIILTR